MHFMKIKASARWYQWTIGFILITKHVPFWLPINCWCCLLLCWPLRTDLLMDVLGKLRTRADPWFRWLLLDVAFRWPDGSVCGETSFPNGGFEERLETDDWETRRSEDRLWAPTAPMSRRIAPTIPADLESADGTWTGSRDEEYTPIIELPDATLEWAWELFCKSCAFDEETVAFASSCRNGLWLPLGPASLALWDTSVNLLESADSKYPSKFEATDSSSSDGSRAVLQWETTNEDVHEEINASF